MAKTKSTIYADKDKAIIDGTSTADEINLGNFSKCKVHAGDGNDTIHAGSGNSIFGDKGNDTIYLEGSSTVDGGAGQDTVRLTSTMYDKLDLSSLTALGFTPGTDLASVTISDNFGTAKLTNIEAVEFLGAKSETAGVVLVGSVSNDKLTLKGPAAMGGAMFGYGGNDTISGAGSSSGLVIDGGTGNDVLTGGSGNDTLLGVAPAPTN